MSKTGKTKLALEITAHGLTVYRLMKMTGIPKTTIYQYVRGEKDLKKARYETIKKLCDALKVNVDDIM